MRLYKGDCLEIMKQMPDGSVDLVLTDPPYNIGIAKWDKIDGYIDWCISWLLECQRLLKPNGVLYFWHNNMAQIAELLHTIREKTSLKLVSFCIWDKGDSYRAQSWANRRADSSTALRSWFNVCEYCLHFFNQPKGANSTWNKTGSAQISSNSECYKELKAWYTEEKERLGLTDVDIAAKYTEVTGKKPFMLRHYFRDSQFAIPTETIWKTVYEPLGFGESFAKLRMSYDELRGTYEGFRKSYEVLRKSCEGLRNTHNVDAKHCNVWHIPPIPTNNRLHTCQKPVPILERLIKVSSNEGGTVLDCFMGSGSTGVACLKTGREFIGIEQDELCFDVARKRLEEVETQTEIKGV